MGDARGGALVLAWTFWLMRWLVRRQELGWLPWRRPVQQQLRAEPVPEVPRVERPAIGPVYHFNFYAPAGDLQAAVIRQAITGTAGDAPERNGK